jgi:hypothetical protein
MVDYLTFKANEHGREFRSFEQSKPDRQSWAQVGESLSKKLENVEKQQKVLVTVEMNVLSNDQIEALMVLG